MGRVGSTRLNLRRVWVCNIYRFIKRVG